MTIMTLVEHRWEVLDQDLVVAFATTESKGGMNYQNSTTLSTLARESTTVPVP
jgi:hypothetical protein